MRDCLKLVDTFRGPERRQRVPVHLVHSQGATITGPLCATDSGFSLHAATVVSHDNTRSKEALVRYVLRPPLAQQRLELLDSGLCRLSLKRAFSDGAVAIELDPLSLLCRLAASVQQGGPASLRRAADSRADVRLSHGLDELGVVKVRVMNPKGSCVRCSAHACPVHPRSGLGPPCFQARNGQAAH